MLFRAKDHAKGGKMAKETLRAGITGTAETVADENNTAAAVGSGILRVFATPMMIALMEKAACDGVAPYLDDGEGTVGITVNVSHDSATPVGMKITARAELTEVDGRRLVFKVEAFDEAGHIGGGMHERFIIKNERFQAKTDAKISQQ